MKKYIPSVLLLALYAAPVMAQTSLANPLNTTDPNELIGNIIKTLLGVVGGIALIFFIYGGFMMLISGGSKDRVDTGRKTLLWATIGLLVVFGSYGLVDAIFSAIEGDSIVS